MTSIAPTVSHALASHDRLGQALGTYCSADSAFNESGNNHPSPHSDGSSPGPNDRLRLMYQGSRAVF
jgi:hypothetical protein